MWLLILLATVHFATADDPCPDEDDIYPCYCSDDYLLTSVNCDNIRGLDKIAHVLSNMKGKNMSMGFWNSVLRDIPSDIFKGQQFRSLHFEQCKIDSFGDRPFTGLEDTLKDIYIYGSIDKRRKDLETFPLGHLKKLEFLSFMANDIKKLGNDWFEDGPESVTDLDLEANDIEELGDQAFAKLVNLEHIWLGDNNFKNVSRSMFPRPANKLKMLEISFNGIESLPEDFFEEMPVLDAVNVSGNRLKSIPENVWGKVWNQLHEVYMERNSGFICDDNLKWIYQREKLPGIFTGRCSGGKFSGKLLEDLTIEDFN